MVDTLPRLRGHCRPRTPIDLQFTFVEAPEQQRTEPNVPNAIVDFFAADVFLAQSGADIDPPAIPANAVVTTDVADLEVAWICRMLELLREHAKRRRV